MTLGTGGLDSSATIKHDDMHQNSLFKQDSLRGRSYQRNGLKSLQNSENKLYQAKLSKIQPMTTKNVRHGSDGAFFPKQT